MFRLATIKANWFFLSTTLVPCAFTFCLEKGLYSSLYLLILMSTFLKSIWLVVFFPRFIILVRKTSLTWLIFSLQPMLVLAVINDNWLFNHFVQFLRLVGLDYFVLDRILKAFIVFCYQGLIFPFCLCCNLLELGSICGCQLCLL